MTGGVWQTEPRLPFDALEAYCATDKRALAELLDVSFRHVDRIKSERGGTIPISHAERYAERLGVHPAVIWGADYGAAIEKASDDDHN